MKVSSTKMTYHPTVDVALLTPVETVVPPVLT